jgi:acyl-CoA synthetase (AMP-forming)/AMP-acid ligase II
VAVVQLHADHAGIDEHVLGSYCADRLARYKVPARWRFVDGFTRTPMGKIRKADLRDG